MHGDTRKYSKDIVCVNIPSERENRTECMITEINRNRNFDSR